MNFRVKTFWIRIGICVWWIVENHLGKYSRCVGGCMLGHFIIVRFHVPSWCNVMRGTWSLTTIQCYKSKQDGAASESSSSRGRIVRKFSCQEIRHWSLDFGHWILELRHWTLELVLQQCCCQILTQVNNLDILGEFLGGFYLHKNTLFTRKWRQIAWFLSFYY